MQVLFNSIEELQKRVAQLGIVVARKANEKVYTHVRVYADGGAVKITGVDIDSSLTVTIPSAKADGPFDLVLPYDKLSGIIANLAAKDATLSYDDQSKATLKASLKTGKSYKVVLAGFPVDKFTQLPVVQAIADKPAIGGYEIGLPGLKAQIEQVDFAIPAADGKFVSTLARLESTTDNLRLVATDGVKLVLADAPANLGEFAVNLPKATLGMVAKLDGGTTVTFTEGEGVFYFVTEVETLTYSRTHGEFPDYTRVVPDALAEVPTKIFIKDSATKDALLSALSRDVFSADKDKPGIRFTVSENGTVLLLEAVHEEATGTDNSTFRNEAADEVDIVVEGKAANVKLDAKLLRPFIERAQTPITMKVKSDLSIVDFHANGGTPAKPNYRFLLMPMRS